MEISGCCRFLFGLKDAITQQLYLGVGCLIMSLFCCTSSAVKVEGVDSVRTGENGCLRFADRLSCVRACVRICTRQYRVNTEEVLRRFLEEAYFSRLFVVQLEL